MNNKKYIAIFITAQLILSASSMAFAGNRDIEVEDTDREYQIDVEDMLIELDKESHEDFTDHIPKEVDMTGYDEIQLIDEKATMALEPTEAFDEVDGRAIPSSETNKSSKRFVYGYTSKGILGGIQNELKQLVFKFKYDNNGNLIQVFE